MRRTNSCLPAALILLASFGCGEATPPQTPPPVKPIGTARPPQPIYGGQPARDDQTIAGCWAAQADDQIYFWFFNADGTCKEAAGIVGPVGKLFFVYHAEGAYRVLPDQGIEVTYHTGPNDRKVGKLQYRLSEDTLELKMGGHWREFKRVTQ